MVKLAENLKGMLKLDERVYSIVVVLFDCFLDRSWRTFLVQPTRLHFKRMMAGETLASALVEHL